MVYLVPTGARIQPDVMANISKSFILYKHKGVVNGTEVTLTETMFRMWDPTDGQCRVMLLDFDGLAALRAKGPILVRYWKAAYPLFGGQPYKPPLDLLLSLL